MIDHSLIYCSANHPITTLNPDRYFRIAEMKADNGKLLIRGERTCWFNAKGCSFYDQQTALDLIREQV